MEPITIGVLTHCGITALMETFFSKGYEKISERSHPDREYLANGHLLKAIRIAMLEATTKVRDEAVTNTILQFGRDSEEGKNADKFDSVITKWLDKEIKKAKNSNDEVIFKSSAYTNIGYLLLEPKTISDKEILAVLSIKVKSEYWDELKEIDSIQSIVPKFFIDYFQTVNESSISSKLQVTDWFDNTCFIFGNILSGPKYSIARDKFNNRLLSEISTELKLQGQVLSEIKDILINKTFYGIGEAFAFVQVMDLQNSIINTYPINNKKLSIGRSSSSDIQLTDKTISNSHAIVHINKNSFSIHDNNSTNGTFVENNRLEPQKEHEFSYGTTFKIGNLKFSILSSDTEGKDLISTPTQAL